MMKSRKFKSVYVAMLLSLLLSVLPVAGGGVALAAAGDLAPLGDQLGDVGQYYSNVSPFLKNRVYVYNTSGSSRTVKVAIYDDKGAVMYPVSPDNDYTLKCTVTGNRILYLRMNDLTASGALTVEGGTGTECYTNKIGFHGLYHMKIWQVESGEELAVAVNTWTGAELGQPAQVSGAYQAVPAYALQSEFALPMFLATRDVNNYWDTEVVVQNVNNETIRVTFEWSADNAPAWANNNYADLAPYERRLFLASQLMYAPGANGTLVEKNYWAWAKVRAFLPANGTPRNIAVITNVFKSVMEGGKPKAEKGSVVFAQFEMPRASTELIIPGFSVVSTQYDSKMRISNPGAWTSNFTIKLYNSAGAQVGSTYSNSVTNGASRQVDGTALGVANGTYTARIESVYPLVAAYMTKSGGGHYGGTAQAVGDTDGRVAYLPFYWSDFYGWDDRTLTTNVGSSSQYYSNIFQRTTGDYKTGNSSPVPTYAIREVNYGAFTNLELYGYDYAGTTGAYSLSVGQFENYSTSHDRVMAYNGIAKKSGTWYVPFAPAPVVQFGWQTKTGTTHPSGEYGIAPAQNRNRVDWLQDMNWVGWTGINTSSANQCNSVQPDGKSRYVADWFGMGNATLQWVNGVISTSWKYDGSTGAYNTYERLSLIRNSISSACAGRPMQIVNEANNSGELGYIGLQGNMTFVELGRASFVFRTWPGDLYGPSFAYRGVEQPHTGHTCTTTDYSQGEAQARAGCHNGFMRGYFAAPGKIIPGQTLKYADIFDGLELHYYPHVLNIILNDPNADDAPAKAQQYRELFEALNGAAGLNPNWLTAAKPIIITESGIVDGTMTGNPPVHTPDLNGIASKVVTFDQIIDNKLGTGTPRFWFTDWCDPAWGSNACAPQHHADILFTASTGITLTVVGNGWHDSLKSR